SPPLSSPPLLLLSTSLCSLFISLLFISASTHPLSFFFSFLSSSPLLCSLPPSPSLSLSPSPFLSPPLPLSLSPLPLSPKRHHPCLLFIPPSPRVNPLA